MIPWDQFIQKHNLGFGSWLNLEMVYSYEFLGIQVTKAYITMFIIHSKHYSRSYKYKSSQIQGVQILHHSPLKAQIIIIHTI